MKGSCYHVKVKCGIKTIFLYFTIVTISPNHLTPFLYPSTWAWKGTFKDLQGVMGSLVWTLLVTLGPQKGPRFKRSGAQGNLVHALYQWAWLEVPMACQVGSIVVPRKKKGTWGGERILLSLEPCSKVTLIILKLKFQNKFNY